MCISTNNATTKPSSSLENDPRPLVSDLLAQHAKDIAVVREAIQSDPLFVEHYDDLWILRFVLSNPKAKTATEAALKAMKYRHENKLNEIGDIRSTIYNHQLSPEENLDTFPIHKSYFAKYTKPNAVMHTLPDPDRGVVTYVFPGRLNMGKVAKELSPDEFNQVEMWMNEANFQIVDEVTRRTGRLTKCIRVMDMTDMSVFAMDRKYVKLDAGAGKTLEDCYPQLLGKIMVVNSAGWIKTTWATLKHFFPKSMVEKFEFCEPSKDKKALERLENYISNDNLHEMYGGESPVWPPAYAGENFASKN